MSNFSVRASRVVFVASVLALASPAVLLATPTYAQTFTITDIANSTSDVFDGFGRPSVNSSGTLAFQSFGAGGTGIYTATSTASFNTIARNDSPAFNLLTSFTSINASGTVAFQAFNTVGENGIYTATSTAAFNTVAITTSPEFSGFAGISLNDAGSVAFFATRDAGSGGGRGIYKATNSASFITVAQDTSPEFANFAGFPSINNAGTVAFLAARDAGGAGIYTAADAGGFNAIALESSPEFNGFGANPTINDSGVVAFLALRDAGVGGGDGLYTASNTGGFSTVALTTGPEFSSFTSVPAINGEGTVAFLAARDAGGTGLYAKLSFAASPTEIIKTGDSLFGSTVAALEFDPNGIADNNIVAFGYRLDNGVFGVARVNIAAAVVPEANTFALALPAIGIVGAVLVRRRKR